jgi:hypothetical protein
MRTAEIFTPDGTFIVNDEMSEQELASYGVNDRLLFAESPDEKNKRLEATIEKLEERLEKLEKKEEQ